MSVRWGAWFILTVTVTETKLSVIEKYQIS